MTDLVDQIKSLVTALSETRADDIEAAIDAATDDLMTGDRATDLPLEACLQGIRWGCRDAVKVEMGGAKVLRIIEPGGTAVAFEWHGRAGAMRDQIMTAVRSVVGE